VVKKKNSGVTLECLKDIKDSIYGQKQKYLNYLVLDRRF
jgi:hypothetical protein